MKKSTVRIACLLLAILLSGTTSSVCAENGAMLGLGATAVSEMQKEEFPVDSSEELANSDSSSGESDGPMPP